MKQILLLECISVPMHSISELKLKMKLKMNLHQWILYFCLPFLVEGIRHLNALTHPTPQEPWARLNVADYRELWGTPD